MQTYTTTTVNQKKVSFHIGAGFWKHVTMIGNIGTDQHGDRWILKGDRLYSEFSSTIVSLQNCML